MIEYNKETAIAAGAGVATGMFVTMAGRWANKKLAERAARKDAEQRAAENKAK